MFVAVISIISCEKSQPQPFTFDFTGKDFKEKELTMNDYPSIFTFSKLNDSLLIVEGSIFQGWKKESIRFSDTLELKNDFKVTDSTGYQTHQVLFYSKPKRVSFQLTISASKPKSFLKGKIDNTASEIPSENIFNYEGRLFIDDKKLKYFSEELWIK
ncbi:hypothetical protein HNP38_001002 [Chryseobacterium defluvii]|uniref:Uncharacterized protein n=1 Tax=Chryseobacterium defluvii TaxID=160396 RepID=A0A840KDW0_9FLAO|nr:hypothetical protein [Chryseobacterium defluvii]MBB4805730.1 hypothetical protein [Chryseobacterium defluvii]